MKIHIPEPCTENWNEMSPQQQGRHCDKCDKVVTDFSRMNDYQVISHLNENDNACGRFQHWQLEKELKLPILHNPWTRWIKTAAFGGFMFGGTLTGKSQSVSDADTIPPPTETVVIDSAQRASRVVSGSIEQPEDSLNKLRFICFSIDAFTIRIPIDTTQISFELPDSVVGDTMSLEIFTDSTSTALSLKVKSNDTTSFDLVFHENWTFAPKISLNWARGIPGATFTISNEVAEIFTWITGGTTLGFTTMSQPEGTIPETSLINLKGTKDQPISITNRSRNQPNSITSHKGERMTKTAIGSKDLIVYNKRKSSVWWWLLPIPALLFFAGYYWKKNRIMAD